MDISKREKHKKWHKHMLRAQQSNMQPDLRMHICEHISVLQHQKDVNQKQHICVKHDFGEQSHNNGHPAFRYNPVEDSRFRQLIYTMLLSMFSSTQ
ncbi:hypothetical protein TNCV_340171 [Trichonephila clavipes]|nr:hypothetical protein TNCV_340171 [Trichonephila clavipes]